MAKPGRDSPVGTFPVAVGPKGLDHDEVERIIGLDIKSMRSNAIHAIIGWSKTSNPHPCTFSADLYLSLGDQPERRAGNALQLGNSRHHARWRHACNYNQLLDVLPACPTCFEKMLECDSLEARKDGYFDKTAWQNLNCPVCTNWARDMSSDMLQFQRSKKFPGGYMLGGQEASGPLVPICLTYLILEKVSDLTFKMVSTGEWTKTQGICYLTNNCFHEKYAREAIKCALNVLSFNEARDEPDDF